MVQAEAKGLPERIMLTKYAIRNSLLPQVTGLTLALGLIVSGVVLVEIVFGYPGVRRTTIAGCAIKRLSHHSGNCVRIGVWNRGCDSSSRSDVPIAGSSNKIRRFVKGLNSWNK